MSFKSRQRQKKRARQAAYAEQQANMNAGLGLWQSLPYQQYGQAPSYGPSNNPYIDAANKASKSAFNANEQRWKAAVDLYGNQIGAVYGELQGLGDQARTDLNAQYDRMGAQTQAGLMARGLSGSSYAGSQAALVNQERGQAMNRLNDSLTSQRLGYMTAATNQLGNLLASRNDAYPDPANVMQMGQMAGQGKQRSFMDEHPTGYYDMTGNYTGW